MQTLLEAASHIAQEIDRTRQHLANLEQALQGLRPLITIDAATTALAFTATPVAHAVEDIAIVDTGLPGRKVVKTKQISKVKKPAKRSKGAAAQSSKIPSTGAKLWLSCLGRKKLSASELIDVALKKLDLDESARVVIANRARAWLNASAKTGVVVAAGSRNGTHLYKRARA